VEAVAYMYGPFKAMPRSLNAVARPNELRLQLCAAMYLRE